MYAKGMSTSDIEVHIKYTGADIRALRLPPYMTLYEEDEDMTQEQWEKHMKAYQKTLQDNDSSAWSDAAKKWALEAGIIKGDAGNYMWEDFLTREQLVQVLYNMQSAK